MDRPRQSPRTRTGCRSAPKNRRRLCRPPPATDAANNHRCKCCGPTASGLALPRTSPSGRSTVNHRRGERRHLCRPDLSRGNPRCLRGARLESRPTNIHCCAQRIGRFGYAAQSPTYHGGRGQRFIIPGIVARRVWALGDWTLSDREAVRPVR